MSTVQRNPSVSMRHAQSAGEGFVNSQLFAILSRAGFVARALIYGIIGLLAFDLAIGQGGKITNQQGAFRSIEQHPFGHLLLALLAVGLGGYALWRLFRAALGHGREGADRGIDAPRRSRERDRVRRLCVVAVQILIEPGDIRKGSEEDGRRRVQLAGRALARGNRGRRAGQASRCYQLIRGLRKKFLDDSKTEQMQRPSTRSGSPRSARSGT